MSLADEEEHGPNPKGVAGLHKVMKKVQVEFTWSKWDFVNGATGSDELASMKELAVEVKMVEKEEVVVSLQLSPKRLPE